MRKRLSILIALAAASMIAVATVMPVFAAGVHPMGSSGQQIEVYENTYDMGAVCISGYNQSNNYVYACFATPAHQYGYDQLSGYWWVGLVYIDAYAYASGPSGYLGTNMCTVPQNYPTDYFICSSI